MTTPPAEMSTRLAPDTEFGRLACDYLLTVLEGDRRQGSKLILESVGQGNGVKELYLHVLLPAQKEIGRMWLANEISVAEEHFASATTKMVMAQLLSRATIQPRNGKTFLAAAVPGNQHDIGLQAVADFFEMDGWRTIQLGANVPISDLVQAVTGFKVNLLGLSAAQSTQLERARQTISAVREGERGNDVKILLGGLALIHSPELATEMGADGHAASPCEAVAVGRSLLGLPKMRGGPAERDHQ